MDHADTDSRYFRVNLFNGLSLAYIDCAPDTKIKGTILLIHGFPETSYQFRNVVSVLNQTGYRAVAPDYRGAGASTKPNDGLGFTKAMLAADIIMLLDHLHINYPVHVVGHDIGGIIAFALASRWPDRVASVCLSECVLPGTNAYLEQRTEHPVDFFYFDFHCVANLPEALIGGREKIYLEHFFNKRCYRVGTFQTHHIQRYVDSYSQPGALRCALDLYRAFEKDAEDLKEWLDENGKCRIPCMVLSGEHSSSGAYANGMASEVMEMGRFTIVTIEGAGHFASEENPHGFAQAIIGFVQQHDERVFGR